MFTVHDTDSKLVGGIHVYLVVIEGQTDDYKLEGHTTFIRALFNELTDYFKLFSHSNTNNNYIQIQLFLFLLRA